MKYSHIVVKDGVWYPAGTDVPAGAPVSVELTDDVPDGSLDGNEDGAVSTEDVEQLREQAGESLEKQEKSKRGRKPKEV